MDNNLLSQIQGKSIVIKELVLLVTEIRLQVHLEFMCEDRAYTMFFYNVSRVSMNNCSYPLQINELEIMGNREKGWDRDSSFFVYDAEERKISFYCENFDLNEHSI